VPTLITRNEGNRKDSFFKTNSKFEGTSKMGPTSRNNNSLDIAQRTTRANFYSTSKDSHSKNHPAQPDFCQSTTAEPGDESSWNLARINRTSNKFQISYKKSGLHSKNASISIINSKNVSLTQEIATQGRPLEKTQFNRLKDKNLLLSHGLISNNVLGGFSAGLYRKLGRAGRGNRISSGVKDAQNVYMETGSCENLRSAYKTRRSQSGIGGNGKVTMGSLDSMMGGDFCGNRIIRNELDMVQSKDHGQKSLGGVMVGNRQQADDINRLNFFRNGQLN
jgi:hypothetical protein